MKKLLSLTLLLISLCQIAGATVYDYTQGNRLSLLEDPSSAAEYKIQLIRNAKHHIHIISFFWDDSKLPGVISKELQMANARGVEVRILTTLVPTLATDLFGSGKKNLKQASSATFSDLTLNPGRGFGLTINLHEKIFLVDGEKAIIGGRNISDSSLRGKDLEVVMEGAVVNQVQTHFKKMFDFIVAQKIRVLCVRKDNGACENTYKKMKFAGNDPVYFPSQPQFENGEEVRILSHEAIINQYKGNLNHKERLVQSDDILDTVTKIEFKKLRSYNYFLIPTKRYMNYLEKNAALGNSIEVITNSIETGKFSSNMGYIYSLPDALKMIKQGIDIYQWQTNQKLSYVHEKVLIFDEDHVIIGSHNMGIGSTAVSNEIAVEIKSKVIAKRLIDIFDHEKSSEEITRKADEGSLTGEINQNKKLIKLLRKKLPEGLIHEIY